MDFKKLVFVSGKGGVGKTTISAWIAKHLAEQGRRTLLVELGQRSSLQALAQLSSVPTYKPTPTPMGFHHSLLSGLDCLVDYVSSFTKVEGLTQKFFASPMISNLVNVAPGLNDLAILGKLTSGPRRHGPAFAFDHIVIDAPSTGSFDALINAPSLLSKSVSSGPLKTQSEAIARTLCDVEVTQFILVGLLESLPMDEMEETMADWAKGPRSQLTQLFFNKVFPLKQAQIDSARWQQFVTVKIKQQEQQWQRAKAFDWPTYQFPLFTKSFYDYIQQPTGESLRPI